MEKKTALRVKILIPVLIIVVIGGLWTLVFLDKIIWRYHYGVI